MDALSVWGPVMIFAKLRRRRRTVDALYVCVLTLCSQHVRPSKQTECASPSSELMFVRVPRMFASFCVRVHCWHNFHPHTEPNAAPQYITYVLIWHTYFVNNGCIIHGRYELRKQHISIGYHHKCDAVLVITSCCSCARCAHDIRLCIEVWANALSVVGFCCGVFVSWSQCASCVRMSHFFIE